MSYRHTTKTMSDWDGRYGAFQLDEDVVIYDRTNPDAWVQASEGATLLRDELR